MFKKDNLEIPSGKVNTVIGKDTYFSGTINGKGLIRIDGEAEGNISDQGDVIVGEDGRVAAELTARNITIAGHFEGTLEAEGKLEVKSTGRAIGTFKVNGLLVEEGAVLSGNMEMKHEEQTGKSPGKGDQGYKAGEPESKDKSKQTEKNKQFESLSESVSAEKGL